MLHVQPSGNSSDSSTFVGAKASIQMQRRNEFAVVLFHARLALSDCGGLDGPQLRAASGAAAERMAASGA